MSEYTPDLWLVVKITSSENTLYKVFATWGGSYLYGPSWKLNSGITAVEEDSDYYYFRGYSGSVYQCHKNNYGTSGYGAGVLDRLIKSAEGKAVIVSLPKETNWMELNFNE